MQNSRKSVVCRKRKISSLSACSRTRRRSNADDFSWVRKLTKHEWDFLVTCPRLIASILRSHLVCRWFVSNDFLECDDILRV